MGPFRSNPSQKVRRNRGCIIDIQEVEQCAKELDRHYIPSRYPDAYPSGRPEDYRNGFKGERKLPTSVEEMNFPFAIK